VETEDGAVKGRKWRELLGRYIFGLQEAEEPSITVCAILPDIHHPANIPEAGRSMPSGCDMVL
jgi:hypothetical protein